MEFLLNRYRNLTVLLLVVALQLMLIAYQVKTSKDIPLLRVWAVTAVTPVERILEIVRRNTWGFAEDYFVLLGTRQKNDRMQKEIGQLKLENQYLRSELGTADRVQALSVFQSHSPSKTIAARIIGNGIGANSKVVFVDRGSGSGVESGMAVVTPDGIVGKVVASYPTASQVLLITDANFAAGVISQKNRVRGTLKGQGHDGSVLVNYVQNEEKVDPGEWFFTSGDDRIFPKGFPVGQVTAVRNGQSMKQIFIGPSGFQNGLEEVLIVLEAVHQSIPEVEIANSAYKLIPPSPDADVAAQSSGILTTDADRLKTQYKQAGDQTHYAFGEGYASPDFTKLRGIRESQAATKPPPTVAPGASPPAGTKPAAPPMAAGNTASGTVAPPLVKTKPTDTAAAPSSPVVKTKPRTPAPILVTDPTDADPSEPAVLAPVRKPEGETKPKSTAPKPVTPNVPGNDR